MAEILSIFKEKHLTLFLNACFLFLLSLSLLYIFTVPTSSLLKASTTTPTNTVDPDNGCKRLAEYHSSNDKCRYVQSHGGCQSSSYISYLQIFYCSCTPVLGFSILILWLLVLFYLLGNTAASYFCSSLEGTSRLLKLSPAVAGVTLLSLGNGAPDLFSSIASFVGDDIDDVGLNSILGGAFFVSSIVVGIISIGVNSRRISVDCASFKRDVLFFLAALCCLLVIIVIGKINLWGALGYLSLYFVYVFIVSTSEICYQNYQDRSGGGDNCVFASSHALPVNKSFIGYDTGGSGLPELEAPLLAYADEEKLATLDEGISHHHHHQPQSRRWCFNIESTQISSFLRKFLYILELPLYLPRRLTIPVVSEDRWSKPVAVISVTISPLLLAVLLSSRIQAPDMAIYLIGVFAGVVAGTLAFATTDTSHPPTRCLFPWLAGGFLMSITWTYILAQELVSLLVSLGFISGISPSILGLTVLAWGNSVGDLVSNVTLATTGGAEGTQIAVSGCYAGPIFNTLVGLGLSLVFASWASYPSHYVIPEDPYIYETLGFLIGGLLFALVILPSKHMRLDRFLGVGLLALYMCFLFLRVARASGLITFMAAARPSP